MLEKAPTGFAAAAAVLSSFPQEILVELAYEVLDFLQYKKPAVDAALLHSRLSDVGVDVSFEAMNGAINALTFTFREAIRSEASADDLVAGLRGVGANVFSGGVIKSIKYAWTERQEEFSSEFRKVLSIGQLIRTQWKLGMAVASSKSAALDRAFVSVDLHIAKPDGSVNIVPLELSIAEFQQFSQHLKEMSAVMETI